MSERRPISFIATAQPDLAKSFYQDAVGLTLLDVSPFALVFDDKGQMLRVQIVDALLPLPYTVHGWQVSDMRSAIIKLVSKGVEFLKFEHMGQDALGIWTTPNGDRIAWFKDPCGNTLSLTEFT
ncbi:VOC family protein [Planktotalea sp.]|uniref:VOC family protein n=1 Tax=Planktotalea sp. TaxID=2029877 RepID=UPI0035C83B23